jgi:hypothetical protein
MVIDTYIEVTKLPVPQPNPGLQVTFPARHPVSPAGKTGSE